METGVENLIQDEIEGEGQAQDLIRDLSQSDNQESEESEDLESTDESENSSIYHHGRFDSDKESDFMQDSSEEEWNDFGFEIEKQHRTKQSTSLASSSVQSVKKLISLIVDARTFMDIPNWAMLWKNIQKIDRWLISHSVKSKALGPLLPIFARLFDDIDQLVIQVPEFNSKDYHRRLNRDQATALYILNQKWPKLWKQGRNILFEQMINENATNKPESIVGIHNHATRVVLNFVESSLFEVPVRLTLSSAGLSKFPMALLEIYSILNWYLSFLPTPSQSNSCDVSREKSKKIADSIIQSIKILDLSNNSLASIPSGLPEVLPNLQMLNLFKNPISALPRTCTKWLKLRRIRICQPMTPPKISHSHGELSPNSNSSDSPAIPTLVESCLKRLKINMADIQHNIDSSLPPHLTQALTEGKSCESCQLFLWPGIEPFYQSVHFDSRDNSFDTKTIVCGPSFYCKTCLLNHAKCRLVDSKCICEMCIFDRSQQNNQTNYWGCVYS